MLKKKPPTPHAHTHFTTMNWRGDTHIRFLFATMKVNWIFNSSKIIIFEVEKLQFILDQNRTKPNYTSKNCERARLSGKERTCWHLNVFFSSFFYFNHSFCYSLCLGILSFSLTFITLPFSIFLLHRCNSFALCVYVCVFSSLFLKHFIIDFVKSYSVLDNIAMSRYNIYWMLLIYILYYCIKWNTSHLAFGCIFSIRSHI